MTLTGNDEGGENMTLFERVIVPLDGSSLAERALVQARRILRRADAEVILVRAVEASSFGGEFYPVLETFEEEARRYLERVERSLSEQGARVRRVVRVGPAAETILSVADEEKAGLIVMATHGRGGIARWVMGSVAEKIVRASPVPVWVARSFDGRGAPLEGDGSVKTILVPLEGEGSLRILPVVVEVARLHGGAQALLLNVVPEGPGFGVPGPWLTRAYQELREQGIPAEPVLRQGDPASQILETCASRGADLIALCTHGRSGLSRWALGSVTEKVLRAATVPLLVLSTRSARAEGTGVAADRTGAGVA
jgi:nucleotide-binding universal stress UspA family protein